MKPQGDAPPGHDASYEWKAVLLLSLGFGLVGLDRWMVAPLFPFMMKDLHLDYEQFGSIVGILGIAWGIASILMGGLSDRLGRRKILLPAIVLFSLLSGLTGLAGGFLSLVVIRAIMGVMEGSFTPASVAATGEASAPKRRGLNQGFQLSLFALLGLGFGPIIGTQLLSVVPSWRWVFFIVAIPGFILAVLMAAVIREPAYVAAPAGEAPAHRWIEIFRYRNVPLAMLCILCAMSGVFVLGAMMPSYLMDYLHLSRTQMGFITSAIGFGGFLGEFGVAGLSDLFGRRVMAMISFVAAAVLLVVFTRIGAAPVALFILLFVIAFFCLGLLSLMTGPIATESVSPTMIASSVGLVSGAGEIFGGGIAPAIAGGIAQHYGIQYVLYLALGGLICGVLVSFFLLETAPRKAGGAARAGLH